MIERSDGRTLGALIKKTRYSNSAVTSQQWYQDFVRAVHLKNLGDKTKLDYLRWIRQLDSHYPDIATPRIGPAKVLDFLVHLQQERGLGGSCVNQALCAIRLFYRDHLDRDWDIWKKIKIHRSEPLPHVLSRKEVALLLRTFRDGRYRAYFTVVYQCGLRLSEALRIKPKHINGERLVIRIVNGKGRKSREVPITPELYRRLRLYWKSHRNQEWLFPGVGRGWNQKGYSLREALGCHSKPMSKSGVWAALKLAKIECGLDKKHEILRVHTLRHSYATHMLEGGASVRQVAAYLGHSSLKPVLVYLHLTEISEEKARIALETLAMP